jgi:plastocyanin
MGPTTHTVEVAPNGMLMYSPSTLVIHTGDTVTWIFETSPHTVTSGTNCVADPNPAFNGSSNGSSTFSHTFNEAGVFPYFCTVDSHCQDGETGSVTVTP